MARKLKITINGKALIADDGTKLYELLSKAPHQGTNKPLAAVIDNHLVGLGYSLRSPGNIRTVDISTREGMDIYRRTASTILYAAAAGLAPSARVVVGQSIASGYFFEIHNHVINEKFTELLEKRMKEIVKEDIFLTREWITVEEAIDVFKEHNAPDDVKLAGQLKRAEVPMVSLGNYRGYGHGPYAYRTGLIDKFRVRPYEHGIVLHFPDEHGNIKYLDSKQPKLFATYLEAKRWNELIHIENVSDLNEHCIGGRGGETVQVAEALHEKKISQIADQIASQKNIRLVLIAGPSSSGKTTFSKRLRIHLKLHGLEPVALSMDNYYLDREDTPKHRDGSYNFECLEALDIELLNKHLQRLMKGEEIVMPHFSFQMGKRDPSATSRLKLGRGQILITEGIHGLNDALTKSVQHQYKFKIYVSALTQLCLDDHNRIFTTDTRLCRRIVRDRLFRGTGAAETISGWTSVRSGENRYIFPYQENADVMFNSALPYEHSLLKPYAERFLAEVPRDHPSFMEAYRLSKFFSYFIPILSREVPHTSILREFIGESAFSY
jgi:uridine kinase